MVATNRIRATLIENRVLAPKTFVLRLSGCSSFEGTLPGQFAMVSMEDWGTDPLLPRAFSILSVREDGVMDLLVKTAGKATAIMERAKPGAVFELLGPLGVPFPAPTAERVDWLIAGGVGFAPLSMHAERASAAGLSGQVTMFYGGRSAADLVLSDTITGGGASLVQATEDGSAGLAGYVTAAVEAALDNRTSKIAPTLLACGPEPMMKAVAQLAHRRRLRAYLSLEGEMACGVGACLVCAVPCRASADSVADDARRPFRYTCVDGPVFDLADLAGPYAPRSDAPNTDPDGGTR